MKITLCFIILSCAYYGTNLKIQKNSSNDKGLISSNLCNKNYKYNQKILLNPDCMFNYSGFQV